MLALNQLRSFAKPVRDRITTQNSRSGHTFHCVLFLPTSFYLRYSFAYHSKCRY